MNGKTTSLDQLDENQRRLVAGHIGLVSVHLRRHLGDLSVPRRDREWEDLFQEGCLGVIRAAMAYRPESGVAFSSFALRRIQNAVSQALQRRFAGIYVPPKRRPRGARGRRATRAEVNDTLVAPTVRSLRPDDIRHLADRRHDPTLRLRSPDAAGRSIDAPDTIGERLRGKYERAVKAACEGMNRGKAGRTDRGRLARIVAEEHLLVSNETERKALRQIARELRSSSARVGECRRQLYQAVAAILRADPELAELHRRIRTDPVGAAAPVDDDVERDLARAVADEVERRFRVDSAPQRARLLAALLEVSGTDITPWLRSAILGLRPAARQRLIGMIPETTEPAGGVWPRASPAGRR